MAGSHNELREDLRQVNQTIGRIVVMLEQRSHTMHQHSDMGPAWLQSWWFPWVVGTIAICAGVGVAVVLTSHAIP